MVRGWCRATARTALAICSYMYVCGLGCLRWVMHVVLGSVLYGCVRCVGMPELPKGTANDTALYGASDKL